MKGEEFTDQLSKFQLAKYSACCLFNFFVQILGGVLVVRMRTGDWGNKVTRQAMYT